jgi:hypothetical protein
MLWSQDNAGKLSLSNIFISQPFSSLAASRKYVRKLRGASPTANVSAQGCIISSPLDVLYIQESTAASEAAHLTPREGS